MSAVMAEKLRASLDEESIAQAYAAYLLALANSKQIASKIPIHDITQCASKEVLVADGMQKSQKKAS